MDSQFTDDGAQPQHADVYERLYDVRSYTGVYRKRFELDTRDLTEAVVHDLAGTVRPNLNHDIEGKTRRPSLSPRLSSYAQNAAAATMAIDTFATTPRQSPEKPPCPSPIRLDGDPNDPHTLLRAVYQYYCRFGRTGSKGANETTMDSSNFSKLCRESPDLVDASFTRTDVDLIFVKSKKKGERRINYTRFLDALGMIAIQKYPKLALEASVPMLLQTHFSKLPCIVEFSDDEQAQALWSRYFERAPLASSAPPPPPSRRLSTPLASPPEFSSMMPPAVPPRSTRLHRRVSSLPSPPAAARELRRSKSVQIEAQPLVRNSACLPTSSSLVIAQIPAVGARIREEEEKRDDEDEEERLCFASKLTNLAFEVQRSPPSPSFSFPGDRQKLKNRHGRPIASAPLPRRRPPPVPEPTRMATTMQLLPPDYHKQIARELVAFFHSFYRFGGAATTFDLDDPAYQSLFHNVLFASLTVGALVFIVLCVVVVRRTILHIRSAHVQRVAMDAQAMEISAVILLTVLAISSLSGLLGEAQVDYSAGVVRGAMTNTSDLFTTSQHLVRDALNATSGVSFLADGLVVSFNKSDLPEDAFKLSIEALRLTHATKDFLNVTTMLLPTHYAEYARDWEFSYFMLKSTTNFAILAVALASFLSISSIGWSMVSPLRLSIFVILSVVPISHTLIGVYLSSTMLTADFCAAPLNSTATLLHSTPTVNYYIECPTNATNPFAAYSSSVHESADYVVQLQKQIEDYAAHHGDTGVRMKHEFLDPIGQQLTQLEGYLTSFNQTQQCQQVASDISRAIDAYCEFGMVGFFSMWVHQMIICLILFVSVITSVLVYERVHIREVRSDMRYQLLSSYEDDDVEHVYLSSD